MQVRDVNVLSVPPSCWWAVPLNLYVPYHVTPVAVPFAVLLAGGFLLNPYQSSLYQLAEFAAPSYKFCGSSLAEYNLVSVEHERYRFKAVFGGLGVYAVGESCFHYRFSLLR